jgi:mediator of RNA polymerase II transcription subunit 7
VAQTDETVHTFPGDVERVFNLEPGSDPRPHLRQLLVSLLNAYHKLLSEVIEPVPSDYHKTISPNNYPLRNWQATADWMQTLVTNFGWLVNEFRPIQARMTLESMMRRQIDIRREETKAIHGSVTPAIT